MTLETILTRHGLIHPRLRAIDRGHLLSRSSCPVVGIDRRVIIHSHGTHCGGWLGEEVGAPPPYPKLVPRPSPARHASHAATSHDTRGHRLALGTRGESSRMDLYSGRPSITAIPAIANTTTATAVHRVASYTGCRRFVRRPRASPSTNPVRSLHMIRVFDHGRGSWNPGFRVGSSPRPEETTPGPRRLHPRHGDPFPESPPRKLRHLGPSGEHADVLDRGRRSRAIAGTFAGRV
jgi:hypothetical protein